MNDKRNELGQFIKGCNINKKYNTYNLNGEYGIGYTLKGEEFYFDLEDYDKIKDYCWCVSQQHCGYKSIVARDCKTNKNVILSNVILNDRFIDHINRNTFDNRKINLRKCNQSLNSKNQSKPKNSKCEFMGVSFEKGKYRSRIGYNKKKIYLGSYNTLEEAIVSRLKAEKEYFGDYAPQKDLFERYNI